MAENIKITSQELSTLLGQFKGEMEKMENLLTSVKDATTNAKSIWEGDASDTVLGAVEDFQKVFDDVNEKNRKYADFINEVISKYTLIDESQISLVESNANSYSVSE